MGGGRGEAFTAGVDMMLAGLAALQDASIDAHTHPELLAQLDRLKRVGWALPAGEQRLVARLAAEAAPTELGASSLAQVLATRMRISTAQARRRVADAAALGPRRALSGEPLAPRWAVTAAGVARGDIGPEHLKIIRTFLDDLPHWVDATTGEQVEATLGRLAAQLDPEQLRQAADRLGMLLDQDGAPPTDDERARTRYLSIGRQGRDGMTDIKGRLDPQARATLDAVLAKLAAPGMCNPDDQAPCLDQHPDPAVAHRDTRTPGQRNHDALIAMARSVLASGELGQHNGLPATIIVSTTLQELQSATGQAVTGGGTLLPMPDVIRLATHAHHYVAVFDRHTSQPLYLGHSKRIASPAQRIILHAKDRGCTRPGCTAPGYWCQVHHVAGWAADNGPTNITNETLACPPDNRLVENGGWTTRTRKDGRTEWIPPPHLDTGQPRINNYHPTPSATSPNPTTTTKTINPVICCSNSFRTEVAGDQSDERPDNVFREAVH